MNEFNARITLKDIAYRADLSVSAVSMALKNDATMSAKTVERVKLLASEMGYTPDPALSALSAYRNRRRVHKQFSILGFVTNWSSKDEWSSRSNSQQVIQGAQERALQLGYSLQLFWAGENGVTEARFSQILRARGIRGLILAPFENNDDRLDLNWKDFSVVTISRPTHYAGFHHVVQNHYMDVVRCWEKLTERGYRRVGLIVEKEFAIRWSHQWEAAHFFASYHNAQLSDVIPTLEVEGDQEVEMIRAWLKKYKPDAVINRCDHFHEALAAEKIRCPEDLGYVSLNVNDDIENATGIRHRRDVLGSTAVDVLNSLLQRNARGVNDVPTGTQVDGIWQEGSTLPSLKIQV